MTNESKLCGYIIYSDGKIDRDCSSASMLYNVHYGQVEDILDELLIDNFYDHGTDYFESLAIDDEEVRLTGNGCIEFELTNLSWFDGQMSFPETCQWDIEPHWEFDFKVIKHEKFPDEEDYIVNPPPSSRSEW